VLAPATTAVQHRSCIGIAAIVDSAESSGPAAMNARSADAAQFIRFVIAAGLSVPVNLGTRILFSQVMPYEIAIVAVARLRHADRVCADAPLRVRALRAARRRAS
jgi:hypothetical protein